MKYPVRPQVPTEYVYGNIKISSKQAKFFRITFYSNLIFNEAGIMF